MRSECCYWKELFHLSVYTKLCVLSVGPFLCMNEFICLILRRNFSSTCVKLEIVRSKLIKIYVDGFICRAVRNYLTLNEEIGNNLSRL